MTMNEILEYVATHGRRVPFVDVLNADPDQSAAHDNRLRIQALIADDLLGGRASAGGELSLTPAGRRQLDQTRDQADKKAAEKAYAEAVNHKNHVYAILLAVFSAVAGAVLSYVVPQIFSALSSLF